MIKTFNKLQKKLRRYSFIPNTCLKVPACTDRCGLNIKQNKDKKTATLTISFTHGKLKDDNIIFHDLRSSNYTDIYKLVKSLRKYDGCKKLDGDGIAFLFPSSRLEWYKYKIMRLFNIEIN